MHIRIAAALLFSLFLFSGSGESGDEAPGVPQIPEDLWKQLAGPTGLLDEKTGALGYGPEWLGNFSGSLYRLPLVERLFGDVRALPRSVGRLSDLLIAAADDPAALVRLGFHTLGTSAARGVNSLPEGEWGHEAVPKGAEPNQALGAALRLLGVEEAPPPLDAAHARLLARVLLGMLEAEPWLEEGLGRSEDGSSVLAPFEEGSPAQVAAGLRCFETTKHGFMALGSALFARRLQDGVAEYRASGAKVAGKTIRIETPHGPVIVGGGETDTHPGGALLVVDTGGDDTYQPSGALASAGALPVTCVVDLSGKDLYRGGAARAMFSLSVVLDIAGDDTYEGESHAQAVAWHGVALLMDLAGDDSYLSSGSYAQACAHDGLALLLDREGDDLYRCRSKGQGYGGSRGCGLLVDLAGNDRYEAGGEPSEAFHERVTLVQGIGMGRRADFGDGVSLAGGVGGLIDVAGDDAYTGKVYSQGAGYWWGLGFLIDRKGNDDYRAMWYSLGSAPHFALGACIDLEGDDRYNAGDARTRCQWQACARDGAIAVFLDGAGNDEYHLRNRCAGAADLNSIALFWDRSGDDRYHWNTDGSYAADASFGAAAVYAEPFGNFRDRMPTVGLFLDSGGNDEYVHTTGKEQDPEKLPPFHPADDKAWRNNEGPVLWGLGLDAEGAGGGDPKDR